MVLFIGAKGFDSASAIDAHVARNAGARFQMRYSAGMGESRNDTKWKLCQPGEIAEITAAGSFFGANSEWYEDRVLEGYNAGRLDGVADLLFWKSRGLERGK